MRKKYRRDAIVSNYLLQKRKTLFDVFFLGFKLQIPLHEKGILRFEPSSRTALNGELPYPWELLHPQDAMSRHRGAKPCRRYGLLGMISLLSPG